MAACKQTGWALEFVSPRLQADKEVVHLAAQSDGAALKFARNGWNQDPDCLIASGIWDPLEQRCPPSGSVPTAKKLRLILSTKFSLGQESSPIASQFVLDMKGIPWVRDHCSIYSPNAVSKSTCDPEWTRMEWPCRGTRETCQTPECCPSSGIPQPSSCWRYSFRYQLEHAHRSGGCMVQVMERNANGEHELGKGQAIESVLANMVGIPVFRIRIGLKSETVPILVARLQQHWQTYREHGV